MASPTPPAHPEDDDDITPEEMAAILEGLAEIERGEGIPWSQVLAECGLLDPEP